MRRRGRGGIGFLLLRMMEKHVFVHRSERPGNLLMYKNKTMPAACFKDKLVTEYDFSRADIGSNFEVLNP